MKKTRNHKCGKLVDFFELITEQKISGFFPLVSTKLSTNFLLKCGKIFSERKRRCTKFKQQKVLFYF